MTYNVFGGTLTVKPYSTTTTVLLLGKQSVAVCVDLFTYVFTEPETDLVGDLPMNVNNMFSVLLE